MQEDATRLSPAQAAAMLDISPRTLRRWSVAFEAALGSSARRKGKRRAYSSQDIETLRRAQQELASGRTLAEVSPGLPVVDPDAPASALVLSPEQSFVLGQLSERSDRMADTVTNHDDRLADLEAYLRLPWYRRLFGSPTPKMKEPPR